MPCWTRQKPRTGRHWTPQTEAEPTQVTKTTVCRVDFKVTHVQKYDKSTTAVFYCGRNITCNNVGVSFQDKLIILFILVYYFSIAYN